MENTTAPDETPEIASARQKVAQALDVPVENVQVSAKLADMLAWLGRHPGATVGEYQEAHR
jgi:2C-methyl-D-erythritol 2,4-cyclodiphosphate synthase